MTTFRVIPTTNGKFAVVSDNEVLHEGMESRDAAELCCQQLNYNPGKNPCDTFYRSGRWTQKQERSQAA